MTEAQHQMALARARQGDGRSTAALLERFRPYIRLLLRGMPRRGDGEGHVQEAVREVTQEFGQFDGETVAEFLAWVRSLVQGVPMPTLRLHPGKQRRAGPSRLPQEQVARLARRLARVPEDMQELLLNIHMDRKPFAEDEIRSAYAVVLRRLNAECRQGKPDREEVATFVEAGEDFAPLLAEALAELRSRGRLDLAGWRKCHPDQPAELAALLGTMQALDAILADCLPDGERPASPTPAAAPVFDTWATMDGRDRPAPPPQEQIGRYTILQELGAGGMGVVYKAHDPQLQRDVAIKVPGFEEVGQMSDIARTRFLREARTAAAIRHPHVCPIYDVGEQAGTPYVVMAYVEGQSLAGKLGDGRLDDLRLAVRLAREVAEALAAVHAHGIIHRDLKPGNILLDGAGHALLTDFGLSLFESDATRLTAVGTLTGTPAYMAPEQARCEKVDARSDLFSLGSVLYQVFTGRLPFEGKSVAALLSALALDEPRPLAESNPDLPAKLAALLMQLLDKDPSRRPQSAQEVVERLRAVERDPAGRRRPQRDDTRRGTPETRTPRPAKKKRRMTALVVGLLVGAVASVASVVLCVPLARSTTGEENGRPQAAAANRPKPLPLKVVLLAGQSNMGGMAPMSTLDRLAKDAEAGWVLPKIRNADGTWKTRESVWVSYRRANDHAHGPLTAGFGESDREFGPELLMGHVLADAVDNPILLVKVVQGAMSLGVEGRPPSSGGTTGPFYKRMIETVRAVLADPNAYYPAYEGQGCELAGFVWFQGWNDHLKPALAVQYEFNLVHLIEDVRRDLGVLNLPVVVGELGMRGKRPTPQVAALRKAQATAVARPAFAGSVVLVKTSEFSDEEAQALFDKGYDTAKNQWRDEATKKRFETMGNKPDYLYLGSGKTIALVGNAFGEAMRELWRKPAGR
jgi:serine/threonine-protein kinase